MPDKDEQDLATAEDVPRTSLHAHGEGREEDVEGNPTPEVGEEGDLDKGPAGNPVSEAAAAEDVGTNDSETRTDDAPTADEDNPSKGALDSDDPEIGSGTGEGSGGLGTQTGALGGAQPTEPADASPERRQDRG